MADCVTLTEATVALSTRRGSRGWVQAATGVRREVRRGRKRAGWVFAPNRTCRTWAAQRQGAAQADQRAFSSDCGGSDAASVAHGAPPAASRPGAELFSPRVGSTTPAPIAAAPRVLRAATWVRRELSLSDAGSVAHGAPPAPSRPNAEELGGGQDGLAGADGYGASRSTAPRLRGSSECCHPTCGKETRMKVRLPRQHAELGYRRDKKRQARFSRFPIFVNGRSD